MKYIINIGFISLITIFFTACAPNELTENTFVNKENKKIESVLYAGSLESGMGDEETEVRNLALMFKEAAKTFKKHDFEYFILGKKAGIPPQINNFDYLINYCYPSYYKNSSLEDKCNITPYINNSTVRVYFRALKKEELTYDKFVWSVKDVLENKNIEKIISETLEDYDIDEVKFIERKSDNTLLLK